MAEQTIQDSAAMKLVLPLDRSGDHDVIIRYATAIARAGDEVLLLTVVSTPDISPVVMPKSVSMVELRQQVRDDAKRELVAIAETVKFADGVSVRFEVADGSTADEIVRRAPSEANAMIIMNSHGRSALARIALGSVSDRVARSSASPVLIVRLADAGNEGPAIRRIIVPLDGSSRSERAIPKAVTLAKRLGVPMLLVTVSEVEQMITAYGTAFSPDVYAEIASESEIELMKKLDANVAQITAEGIDVSAQVLSGPTVHAIDSVTDPGDLVCMTSHGRGGVRRWFLGSVAEKLVRTTKAPVLLVPSM